jgi:hypothetical protein
MDTYGYELISPSEFASSTGIETFPYTSGAKSEPNVIGFNDQEVEMLIRSGFVLIGTTRSGDKIEFRYRRGYTNIDEFYIIVYKAEDGWYYLMTLDKNGTRWHYKCDQLEGLKSCLKYFDVEIKPKSKPIEPKKNFFQRVKSRLFEERLFESSELYWNISFNDIHQGRLPFNDNEKLKLSSIFRERVSKNLHLFYIDSSFVDLGITPTLKSWYEIRIYKLYDNYYLVIYEDDSYDEYHKCDDWEGLVLCLDKEYGLKIPMKINDLNK